MTTKTKTQTFETAYRSLEALVHEIETRELELEEGITKFEQGLELAQFCKERLAKAEHKVVVIKKKFANVLNMKAPDDDAVDPPGFVGLGEDEEPDLTIEDPDEEKSGVGGEDEA